MSENSFSRSSISTASSAVDEMHIAGDQPRTSSVYMSQITLLSPATLASMALTNTAARSAFDAMACPSDATHPPMTQHAPRPHRITRKGRIRATQRSSRPGPSLPTRSATTVTR